MDNVEPISVERRNLNVWKFRLLRIKLRNLDFFFATAVSIMETPYVKPKTYRCRELLLDLG